MDKENRKQIYLLTSLVLFLPVVFSIYNNFDLSFTSNISVETEESEESENIENREELASHKINIDNSTSTMLFVGDIMLSRGINQVMERRGDWNYPFIYVADFLRSADLVFGNLEGPISDKGYDTGGLYSFRANPLSIQGLLFAGFDILSVANNHMFDYSSEALIDTFRNLEKNNISYVGAGDDFERAHKTIIKNVNGINIGFLAYTNLLSSYVGSSDHKPNMAYPDKDQILLDIKNTKDIVDFVVLSFHWGDEYETKSNSYQQDLAYFVIDNGADLVIGHHPHVVQEVEKYKEGYIAYSLGNFIFDQNFSEDTGNGLILEVTIDESRIINVKKHRVEFTDSYQPFLVRD